MCTCIGNKRLRRKAAKPMGHRTSNQQHTSSSSPSSSVSFCNVKTAYYSNKIIPLGSLLKTARIMIQGGVVLACPDNKGSSYTNPNFRKTREFDFMVASNLMETSSNQIPFVFFQLSMYHLPFVADKGSTRSLILNYWPQHSAGLCKHM